ncbi:MAG: hypothetical protein KBC50_01735 [Candidatus Pacebacteria bacterium]|jgi:hypothetical protein|nr:hypothetical protein [Candidatus Paceibacterota bacterium]
MKLRSPFFLASMCMVLSVSAQASMHGTAEAAGMSHYELHAHKTELAWQALAAGNFKTSWQMLTDQAVCTSVSDATFFLFSPMGWLVMLISSIAVAVLTHHLLRKAQRPWWNRFRKPINYRHAHYAS